MDENMNSEMVAMQLISYSGDARANAFRALEAAKAGNFEEADELMKQAKENSLLAHHVQTDILTKEADGEKTELNILLVHAQDHLMTSMLAQELIKEIIELYKNK